MKVFVTGATGFIGSALVRRLLEEGNEVTALVRNSGHGLPSAVNVVYGDLLTPGGWKDSGRGCKRLYHLAAMVSFDSRRARELMSVNGTGTSNVLEASSDWNLESTVVLSSACTMGLSYSETTLLNEGSVPDKRMVKSNPYLRSKLAAEVAAVSFSENRRVVIVNPTTVYGPGDRTLNSGTLIKKISFASVLPVPQGGSNVVDVEDVVEGIILAGERGSPGERYAIGGQNMTYRRIFSQIAKVLGRRPLLLSIPHFMRLPLSSAAGIIGKLSDSRFLTRQIVDDMFAYKYFSTELAEKKLGYKRRFDFEASVERAVAYYREEGLLE